jgi:carboxymethylenebutenolidase
MKIATESIILKSDGSDMGVYIARPEAKKGPGLIVFQEAFGVNDHIKDVTRRFAEQGYVAIAPELFHRTAPPGFTGTYGDFASLAPHFHAVTTEGIASDARAAFDWLSKDSQVDNAHIGSIGFCMGGRCSFIANAKLPLQAVVSFYGGGIVPALLDLAQEQSGPILFFWGGLDQHIGPEQRNGIADEMTKAGKPYINVEISDANHAFFCDARPSYNAIAAKHAWALTLSFLETHLKS